MRRFENINLLRALAALAVVVYHVVELGHWDSFPDHEPLLAFRIGWIGFDLFFVISGFVITYSAILLYRQNPDGFARHVNWTLAVEMQFYLAVALLVPWLARTPGWRIWLVCAVVAWAWHGAMFLLHATRAPGPFFMAVSRLPGATRRIRCRNVSREADPRRSPPQQDGIAIVASGCVHVWLSRDAPVLAAWVLLEFPVDGRLLALGARALPAVLRGFSVWLPQTLGTRWLKPFDHLGEISYGIYLWQLVAIDVAIAVAGPRPALVLAVTLALTTLVSALSWRYFEKPVMDLARTPSLRVRNARAVE